MKERAAAGLAAALLLFSTRSVAQEAPFEPETESQRARSRVPPPADVSGFDPLGDVAVPAIRAYQLGMRGKSVARCPYRVSCSRYALRQIERHGFVVGFAYFLDRFLFRENEEALRHYPT
ncbi:MAG: membrane protein insertion efficiency factor YidD, partial [Myxococcota bacterium]